MNFRLTTKMNFRWFREFVRRHTNPIAENRAEFWKGRISFLYMIVAWNAFGLALYMVYKGKAEWMTKYKSDEELKLTPAQQWTRTLGIQNAKVYRISGLNVTQYDIKNNPDENKADNTTTQ